MLYLAHSKDIITTSIVKKQTKGIPEILLLHEVERCIAVLFYLNLHLIRIIIILYCNLQCNIT